MKAAIRDNNQFSILNRNICIAASKEKFQKGDYIVEIGKADVKRSGDISTEPVGACIWSRSRRHFIEENVDVEVLDCEVDTARYGSDFFIR